MRLLNLFYFYKKHKLFNFVIVQSVHIHVYIFNLQRDLLNTPIPNSCNRDLTSISLFSRFKGLQRESRQNHTFRGVTKQKWPPVAVVIKFINWCVILVFALWGGNVSSKKSKFLFFPWLIYVTHIINKPHKFSRFKSPYCKIGWSTRLRMSTDVYFFLRVIFVRAHQRCEHERAQS